MRQYAIIDGGAGIVGICDADGFLNAIDENGEYVRFIEVTDSEVALYNGDDKSWCCDPNSPVLQAISKRPRFRAKMILIPV